MGRQHGGDGTGLSTDTRSQGPIPNAAPRPIDDRGSRRTPNRPEVDLSERAVGRYQKLVDEPNRPSQQMCDALDRPAECQEGDVRGAIEQHLIDLVGGGVGLPVTRLARG